VKTFGLRCASVAVLFLAVSLLGCGPADDGDAEAAQIPIVLGDQEDAVCGMLVREQSAPRSQVVHSDGSRFFFCSIGDMLVHLGAPSPHGRTKSIFVEVMKPDEDPSQSHTGPHPWVPAEAAVYVVGIERRGIMGEPVLTYATTNDAEQVVARHTGAQILDSGGLREWWDALEAAR
jgi:nitrous oxide reductase accessory protein NosL